MSPSVHDELSRMRVVLQGLEGRLEAGEVPSEALPEFKSMVDEIRLQVWSLLTAAGTEEPRIVGERFRVRRAAELCRSMADQLSAGSMGAGHPEWAELQQAAARLQATIAERTGQAA